MSLTLATLSLVMASGVVLVDPPSGYHTEFADPFWAWSALVLTVPVAVVSYQWPGKTTFYAIAAALLPQIWLAIQYVVNAAAADWTGPFDLLAFIWPITDFIFYGMATALVADVAGRRPPPNGIGEQQH
ncbi:MAG TPA: hypothetical protein DGG94_01010 [Micromonosporaceae bacterium]|nr:hypothetical protein [Micromonosporaceae bacterium]HCU48411.1 hypothetical protein [Micromonosporaceae bacterium]